MLTLVVLLGMAQTTAFAQTEPVTTWAELKAAVKAGGEIQLQSNVTAAATDSMLTISKSVSVTLDLNGYTIDRALNSPTKKGSVFEVNGALTEAQKALVVNYATLTAAETTYVELKAVAENENQDQPTDSTNPTDPTDPFTPDTNAGSCPLCGEDHGNNIGMKAIHLVIYWLTWLFRDWLPGFFK